MSASPYGIATNPPMFAVIRFAEGSRYLQAFEATMHSEKNAVETFEQLTQAAADFLIVDAETAQTLLDSAELSADGPERWGKIAKAREALATIDHFTAKLSLHSTQRSAIERARDELEGRLKRFETGPQNDTEPAFDAGADDGWPYPEGMPR